MIFLCGGAISRKSLISELHVEAGKGLVNTSCIQELKKELCVVILLSLMLTMTMLLFASDLVLPYQLYNFNLTLQCT